ncbi:Cys-Gln thioester bond-forming surface protein [Streptomyces sp. GC420]|uniref:Cys-Gln thioester bond-forming surface protein n=1 Tax=Streptomyces sp. GC420 TaxID=2697568 RepID=UPI001414F96C|nr:TQXA domain-containing protein [Streptomyces sp. GC420]NBM15556.1 Cys-Gln thioester bond-forming surface protein [Streptomyces sp. GC420]
MRSARRRGTAVRLAAAVLTAGLAGAGSMAATTGVAAADEAPPVRTEGGATATLGGLEIFGQAVIREDGEAYRVSAGLFEMSVLGGGTLKTYCIDVYNPTQSDATYKEVAWSESSLHNNADAGKIRWILQNSYPQVNDLAALAKQAGAGALTEQSAAAGTQVAIWRYSDNADVEALDPDAEKLADYLEASARDLGEPTASLSLGPSAVSGRAGEKLGPVTVHTDARSVTVAPAAGAAAAGIRAVDKDGEPVTSAADGSELFFDVPEDTPAGSTSLTVSATTNVPVGRAFISETKSQTQILAGSSDSTVSVTATANWARKGAIPALSAQKNCEKHGLDITAANEGDEDFTFELMGIEYTIAAGTSRTVTIPLQEDQAYDFTITGPHGFERNFRGVLDCETAGTTAANDYEVASAPSPASAGGTGADVNLADTGGGSATPMIAGIAVAMVVAGSATVFVMRRKNTAGGE